MIPHPHLETGDEPETTWNFDSFEMCKICSRVSIFFLGYKLEELYIISINFNYFDFAICFQNDDVKKECIFISITDKLCYYQSLFRA